MHFSHAHSNTAEGFSTLGVGNLPKILSREIDFGYCFQILPHCDRENCQEHFWIKVRVRKGTPHHHHSIPSLFLSVSQRTEENVCPYDTAQL